ncbi:unnamed protein product, partial [Meganyctiphanes norvegica]
EKALQWLKSPCFCPEDYKIGERKPVVIFLVFMRFIMEKLPNACIDGIWEEIIKQTVLYSRNFSEKGTELFKISMNFYPYTYDKVATGPQMITWLEEALSNKMKCTNPYIRLELFRLIRIMRKWQYPHPTCETMFDTFIHTMSEINPHHVYPSGGVDKVLFGFTDLRYIIKYNKEKNIIDCHDRNGSRFLSHCIQLIGKFAVTVGFISDLVKQINRIRHLCNFLFELRELVIIGPLEPQISKWAKWDQFRYIVSSPPFRPYIVETLCDLTASIINCKGSNRNMACIMDIRDSIVQELNVGTNIYDLPRLLMSRQIQGPKPVCQHSLLLNNLTQMYKNVPMKRVIDSNNDVNHINIINFE